MSWIIAPHSAVTPYICLRKFPFVMLRATSSSAHVSAEHLETRKQDQKQAVLNAKRQTLSDMLMNEVNEIDPGHGRYRDITVKWLGSAADRIMAGTDLTFEEKKEALDELVRMVDEENVISDGDKAAFEAKYFYHTEERPHL